MTPSPIGPLVIGLIVTFALGLVVYLLREVLMVAALVLLVVGFFYSIYDGNYGGTVLGGLTLWWLWYANNRDDYNL